MGLWALVFGSEGKHFKGFSGPRNMVLKWAIR